MKQSTCCFTGHRMIAKEDMAPLLERLTAAIRDLAEKGVTTFVAGGALGFDTLAAQAVLAQRETLGLTLKLILPCKDQCRGWRAQAVMTYNEILEAADEVIWTGEQYTRGCMHVRNRRMVAESAFCICYLKEPKGGTAYTVKYAKDQGLNIINLANEGQTNNE